MAITQNTRRSSQTTALVCLALFLLLTLIQRSAFGMSVPATPTRYFNDYASLVSPQTADSLNARLEQYERTSSNQLRVMIYPALPQDAALEDFTLACYRAWGFGQRGKDNGLALFIFVRDHKARIEVGYGLEGKVTDALAGRIIRNELAPGLRANTPDSALTQSVVAMIAATNGEYTGTGSTEYETRHPGGGEEQLPGWAVTLIIIIFVLLFIFGRRVGPLGILYAASGWSSGGGSWGGGGFSGGGGGGFASGGGGSAGGGGASGSW